MSRGASAAAKLRVRSALNPMLWLCGIISPLCFVLGCIYPTMALPLLLIGAMPIGATVIGFLYLMVVAPEKLQSEDYQLRHETLQLIKQKGSSIEIEPSSLDAIANPTPEQIVGLRR